MLTDNGPEHLDTAIAEIEKRQIAEAVVSAEGSLGRKIIRSVTFGALRYVFLAPIPFVMTPFILHKIGVAGYGTWAVFLAINSMTSLADLGLVGTLSKFVAEYHARRDFTALSRLLSSAIVMFSFLGLAAACLVGAGTHLLVTALFRGSSISRPELATLLHCFLVVIVANILGLLLSSITSGLQRLDLTYIMSTINILVSAVGGGLLLLRGWGLRGLVYAYAGSAVLTLLGYALIVKRLLPQISLSPWHFDRGEARKMLGFSLRLYIIQASLGIQNQIDKVFLAVLIGVAPVGWFDIASDVAIKVRAVIGLILGPVLPAASELSALEDEARTRELYYRTHKYLAVFGIPAVVCANAFGRRFVELWLGTPMAVIAFPMTLLITVSFVNLASGPGFLIFAGRGYLKPAIQSCALGVILNIFVSLGLIYRFGFAGAAVGTSLAVFFAAIFLIWKFHHESGYPFRRVVREAYLKPILASVVIMAVLLGSRPTASLSWTGLCVMGLSFATLYAVVILLSQFFDEYDWSKIESFFPPVKHARKISWNA